MQRPRAEQPVESEGKTVTWRSRGQRGTIESDRRRRRRRQGKRAAEDPRFRTVGCRETDVCHDEIDVPISAPAAADAER